METSEKKLRFGVVGVGMIGTAHVCALRDGLVPDAVLAAVCDKNETRRKKLAEDVPGVPIFSTPEELFSSGLCDAVILSVPHYLHAPLACAAFSHGLHVLTEKPGSVTVSGVRQMVEASKSAGKEFGIMFNQRTNVLFAKAREILRSGRIGELRRTVWLITTWFRKDAYYASGDWRATWSGEGGGVLMNQAVHNLDLWQWICGMPVSVRAECTVGKYHDIEVEDEAAIYSRYANGATGVFLTSTGDYPGTNRLEIDGTKGKMVLESNKLTLTVFAKDVREYLHTPEEEKNPVTEEEFFGEKYNGHVNVLENFSRHVLFGDELIAPGSDALNEAALCNVSYLSSWEGRELSLPYDEARFEAMLKEKIASSRGPRTFVSDEEISSSTYLDRWNTNW